MHDVTFHLRLIGKFRTKEEVPQHSLLTVRRSCWDHRDQNTRYPVVFPILVGSIDQHVCWAGCQMEDKCKAVDYKKENKKQERSESLFLVHQIYSVDERDSKVRFNLMTYSTIFSDAIFFFLWYVSTTKLREREAPLTTGLSRQIWEIEWKTKQSDSFCSGSYCTLVY